MMEKITLAVMGAAGVVLAGLVGVLFWINADLREDKAVLERNVIVLQGAVAAGEEAVRELGAAARKADEALEGWSDAREKMDGALADMRREIQGLRRVNAAFALWFDAALPDVVRGLLGQTGNGASAAGHPGEDSGGSAPPAGTPALAGDDQRGSAGVRPGPGSGPE
jgi:hypothetical protein